MGLDKKFRIGEQTVGEEFNRSVKSLAGLQPRPLRLRHANNGYPLVRSQHEQSVCFMYEKKHASSANTDKHDPRTVSLLVEHKKLRPSLTKTPENSSQKIVFRRRAGQVRQVPGLSKREIEVIFPTVQSR